MVVWRALRKSYSRTKELIRIVKCENGKEKEKIGEKQG